MPSLSETLETVGRDIFINTLNMSRRYWQIRVTDKAIPKTAFRTDTCLHGFTVMPLGLKGAPATFQRLVDDLLSEHRDSARAYLDDIVVLSTKWDKHLYHLGVVLKTLHQEGLTM